MVGYTAGLDGLRKWMRGLYGTDPMQVCARGRCQVPPSAPSAGCLRPMHRHLPQTDIAEALLRSVKSTVQHIVQLWQFVYTGNGAVLERLV